jgi:predicted chitinase
VKGRVAGFPADPVVHHIHPVALVGNFSKVSRLACTRCGSDLTITSAGLRAIFPRISDRDAARFPVAITDALEKYGLDTCNRVSHFLGQCEVECAGFTKFREDLTYRSGDDLWNIYRSALKAGLQRLRPEWTIEQIEAFSKKNLVNNDQQLGEVLFGDRRYPGRDYRGRGLLHMTWLATYEKYKAASGIDVVDEPDKVESDQHVGSDSSVWFWSVNSINSQADVNNVKGVTRIINPALRNLDRRKMVAARAFAYLNKRGEPCCRDWNSSLKTENGW